MEPDPAIVARGLKAYEQARAFERLRSWRLPLTYALAPAVPALFAVAMLRQGHPGYFAAGAAFTLFIAVRVALEWRRVQRRYADNLSLLARLEAAHGDSLPWVQVEKHFAALDEIRRELAQNETRE